MFIEKSKKFISVFLVLCISLSVIAGSFAVFAADVQQTAGNDTETEQSEEEKSKEAQKTLEEQHAELEKNLSEVEDKLKVLSKSSKKTIEYIDTLDQKIGTMNEQLTVLEGQITSTQKQINALKPEIEENLSELENLQKDIDAVESELEVLSERFQATYEAYCYRLRVMYISGDYSIITALLLSKDVSGFFTRYEMIKAIAKSDTELLQEVNEKMDEICTKQDGLNAKKEEFEVVKAALDEKNNTLRSKQADIEAKQESIARKKIVLAKDRAESDGLFAELTAQNQMYTEFRNEDQALIDAVENEIMDLINGIKTADEVTTVASGDKQHSTTKPGYSASAEGVYSKSDAVLNMKYPVPGHYSLSAGFPNYSSGKYHGGIDFPAPTGSKIVAAQSGVVMTVKRLNYSYGYYLMIYHGTDSKGRSVVTLYAHNSSIMVTAGQTVKKGQQIAKAGSTGNSTGPHCHFEIRLSGTRVNPKHYLGK